MYSDNYNFNNDFDSRYSYQSSPDFGLSYEPSYSYQSNSDYGLRYESNYSNRDSIDFGLEFEPIYSDSNNGSYSISNDNNLNFGNSNLSLGGSDYSLGNSNLSLGGSDYSLSNSNLGNLDLGLGNSNSISGNSELSIEWNPDYSMLNSSYSKSNSEPFYTNLGKFDSGLEIDPVFSNQSNVSSELKFESSFLDNNGYNQSYNEITFDNGELGNSSSYNSFLQSQFISDFGEGALLQTIKEIGNCKNGNSTCDPYSQVSNIVLNGIGSSIDGMVKPILRPDALKFPYLVIDSVGSVALCNDNEFELLFKENKFNSENVGRAMKYCSDSNLPIFKLSDNFNMKMVETAYNTDIKSQKPIYVDGKSYDDYNYTEMFVDGVNRYVLYPVNKPIAYSYYMFDSVTHPGTSLVSLFESGKIDDKGVKNLGSNVNNLKYKNDLAFNIDHLDGIKSDTSNMCLMKEELNYTPFDAKKFVDENFTNLSENDKLSELILADLDDNVIITSDDKEIVVPKVDVDNFIKSINDKNVFDTNYQFVTNKKKIELFKTENLLKYQDPLRLIEANDCINQANDIIKFTNDLPILTPEEKVDLYGELAKAFHKNVKDQKKELINSFEDDLEKANKIVGIDDHDVNSIILSVLEDDNDIPIKDLDKIIKEGSDSEKKQLRNLIIKYGSPEAGLLVKLYVVNNEIISFSKQKYDKDLFGHPVSFEKYPEIDFLNDKVFNVIKVESEVLGVNFTLHGEEDLTQDAEQKFKDIAKKKTYQAYGRSFEYVGQLNSSDKRSENISRKIFEDNIHKHWKKVNKVSNDFSDESKSERQIVFTLMEKKDSFYNLNKNKNVFSFFADGYKFLKKSEDITSLSNNIYSLFFTTGSNVGEEVKLGYCTKKFFGFLGIDSDNFEKHINHQKILSDNNLKSRSLTEKVQGKKTYIEMLIDLKKKRTDKDNFELQKYFDDESSDFDKKIGNYSKMNLVLKSNSQLLQTHFSASNVFQNISSVMLNTISCGIVYVDKEIQTILSNGFTTYTSMKIKGMVNVFTQTTLTNMITKHISSTLSVFEFMDRFSDKMFNVFVRNISAMVSFGLSYFFSDKKGSDWEEFYRALDKAIKMNLSEISSYLLTFSFFEKIVLKLSSFLLNIGLSSGFTGILVPSVLVGGINRVFETILSPNETTTPYLSEKLDIVPNESRFSYTGSRFSYTGSRFSYTGSRFSNTGSRFSNTGSRFSNTGSRFV